MTYFSQIFGTKLKKQVPFSRKVLLINGNRSVRSGSPDVSKNCVETKIVNIQSQIKNQNISLLFTSSLHN